MKLDDLIQQLQTIKREYANVPVKMVLHYDLQEDEVEIKEIHVDAGESAIVI